MNMFETPKFWPSSSKCLVLRREFTHKEQRLDIDCTRPRVARRRDNWSFEPGMQQASELACSTIQFADSDLLRVSSGIIEKGFERFMD